MGNRRTSQHWQLSVSTIIDPLTKVRVLHESYYSILIYMQKLTKFACGSTEEKFCEFQSVTCKIKCTSYTSHCIEIFQLGNLP